VLTAYPTARPCLQTSQSRSGELRGEGYHQVIHCIWICCPCSPRPRLLLQGQDCTTRSCMDQRNIGMRLESTCESLVLSRTTWKSWPSEPYCTQTGDSLAFEYTWFPGLSVQLSRVMETSAIRHQGRCWLFGQGSGRGANLHNDHVAYSQSMS